MPSFATGINIRRYLARRPDVLLVCCLYTLFAGYLCFTNLNKSISLSDESLHVKVTQEMYQSGQWWLPTLEGEPYFRKPPFKMWLTFIPLKVLGESNFSYRLIDASLGVLLALAVLFFAAVFLESFYGGVLAGLLLLLNRSFLVSSHGYRHATQDPMLHVLQFFACILFYYWYKRFRNNQPVKLWVPLTFGLIIGLSVLTKNVLGYVAPGLCFLFLSTRLELFQFVRCNTRAILIALTVALVLPLSYMLPHFLFTPGAFENLFLSEVLNRATQGEHNVDRTWYYFQKLYDWKFLPLPLLFFAVVFGGIRALFFRDVRHQYLLVWAITPIIVFSCVQSRLLWYIADSFPALALLASVGIFTCVQILLRKDIAPIVRIFVSLCLIASLWSMPHYIKNVWGAVTRIDRPILMDRVVREIQKHPEARILVYAPPFKMEQKYRCRREKIYLGMLSKRMHLVSDFDAFIKELERPEYTFAIAPRTELLRTRRVFKPVQFVKLIETDPSGHHRDEIVFLLSRQRMDSPLFRQSEPV